MSYCTSCGAGRTRTGHAASCRYKDTCPTCRGTGWLENASDLDSGFATSDCRFTRCDGPGPHRGENVPVGG